MLTYLDYSVQHARRPKTKVSLCQIRDEVLDFYSFSNTLMECSYRVGQVVCLELGISFVSATMDVAADTG
jgi:hypothetical protein